VQKMLPIYYALVEFHEILRSERINEVFAHTFHMLVPIWVKFRIRGLHVVLWGLYELF
jgi:hypothetical protein